MKSPFTNAAEIETAWSHCPWGMVAIDINGKVCATNHGFEHQSGISSERVLGMSEADFDHQLIRTHLVEQHRVELSGGELRAIHYLHGTNHSMVDAATELQLALIAEALREPLASIYGFAELLLTQNYDESTRKDLTEMLMLQSEAMVNLINERLDSRNFEKRQKSVIPI